MVAGLSRPECVNNMGTSDRVKQGTKTSAAMILTYFPRIFRLRHAKFQTPLVSCK